MDFEAMTRLLSILAICALCVSGAMGATTHYVTHFGIPPNTNSLDGLNAWTNINSGDTVHLDGTFTNGIDLSAATYTGDYGNPVTFYFGSNANFTAPAWGQKYNTQNSYSNGNAFYLPNVKSVIIDGGINGLIQATANGVGKQWSNKCDGIYMALPLGGSFEIKNLAISNLMTRSVGANDAYVPGHAGEAGYEITGSALTIGGGFTNTSIHNCVFSGTANLIAISYSLPTADVQIYSNNLQHCSFGVQIYGTGYSGSGWEVWGNTINTGNDWSGNNTIAHGDGIIVNQSPFQGGTNFYDPDIQTNYYSSAGLFVITNLPQWGSYGSYYNYYQFGDTNNISMINGTNVYTTTVSPFAVTNFFTFTGTTNARVTMRLQRFYSETNINMQVYRNVFGPTWGTNATGWFFVSYNMPSGFQGARVFNNLILLDYSEANPTLMGNSVAAGDRSFILNNTFIQMAVETSGAIGTPFTGSFDGGTVLNNCVYGYAHGVSFNDLNTDTRGYGKLNASDYNVYYGISGTDNSWRPNQGEAWPALWYDPSGSPPFFGPGVAIYRTNDGWETYSVTNKPLINILTGQPQTNDTVLVSRGTNLTALAIALGIPQLTNDFYGNPRPSTGPWTIGAIEDTSTNTFVTTYLLTINPGGAISVRTNGEVVTITCTNAGVFNGWTATAGSITAAGSCSTTFTMPAQDATVTAAYTNSGPAVAANKFIPFLIR